MMVHSKNRTLLILIMVLLLTNGIMLYLLNREQPKEPELSRSERMVKMVRDELALNPEQVEEYLKLRRYRDSIMKPIQADLRNAKIEMLQMIRKDSVQNDSLLLTAKLIGDKQALMELEYYNHFKRMQKMLQTDQQPKFDSLLLRMVYRSTGAADSVQRAQTPKEK